MQEFQAVKNSQSNVLLGLSFGKEWTLCHLGGFLGSLKRAITTRTDFLEYTLRLFGVIAFLGCPWGRYGVSVATALFMAARRQQNTPSNHQHQARGPAYVERSPSSVSWGTFTILGCGSSGWWIGNPAQWGWAPRGQWWWRSPERSAEWPSPCRSVPVHLVHFMPRTAVMKARKTSTEAAHISPLAACRSEREPAATVDLHCILMLACLMQSSIVLPRGFKDHNIASNEGRHFLHWGMTVTATVPTMPTLSSTSPGEPGRR